MPAPPAAAHQLTRRWRACSSVADAVARTSALGSRRAEPAPWTSRARFSISIEPAVAQTADESVKTSSPVRNARFAPRVSAIAPAPSIRAANDKV